MLDRRPNLAHNAHTGATPACAAGAYVVSNRYSFPDMREESALVEVQKAWLEVDRLSQLSPDESSHVYLYRVAR